MSAARLPSASAVPPDPRRSALCGRFGQRGGGVGGRRPTGSRRAGGWRSRPSAARPSIRGPLTVEAERDIGRARLTLRWPRLAASPRLLRRAVLGARLRPLAGAAALSLTAWNSLISRAPIAVAAALPASLTALLDVLPDLEDMPAGDRGDRGGRTDRDQVGDDRMLGQLGDRVEARLGAWPDLPFLALAPALAFFLSSLSWSWSWPCIPPVMTSLCAACRYRGRERQGRRPVPADAPASPARRCAAASPASPWGEPRRPSHWRRRSGTP